MHPMERLRHVARSGGIDPAIVVAETIDALTILDPAPSELVSLCRNLVERNPSCGPLWWLCANLLAKPASLSGARRLAESIECDTTASRLAEAVPDDATVLTVGYPMIVAEALRRCGNTTVVAVQAGDDGNRMVRALDRGGVDVEPLLPEAMLAAMRRIDVVVVEADACSTESVVASMGSGLAAAAAAAADVPVWIVAGRGRRLPPSFVESIGRLITDGFEVFPTSYGSRVAGPDGVMPMSTDALVPECPAIPELLP